MIRSLNINKSGTSILLTFILFALIPLSQVYAIEKEKADILVQFALMSDSHLNHSTTGDEANYMSRFEKGINQVNRAGVDFVLIAGDLTQSGKVDEFMGFKKEISKFLTPVWVVPGNHDIGNKFSGFVKGESVTLKRIEVYEKCIGPSWFSVNCAGVHIICINSSLLGSGFDLEKQMWVFLERELCTPSKEPAVLLMHYPLFLKDQNEAGDYWNIEPAPRTRLLGLLKNSHVKMVLTGHLHRPISNTLDGILHVTTQPTSFGIPTGNQPEGWTLFTVFKDGKITQAFQKIE